MKKAILTIMIMLMLPTVLAISQEKLCGDTQLIGTNCTLVTPLLSCGNQSYTIINVTSGSVVKNDSLSSIGNGIFKFNFTQPQGEYIIKLCDGTTREVRVSFLEEGSMPIAIIILLPLILGIIFLVGAVMLNEIHWALKIFLFLLSIITFFSSAHFGMLAVVKFYGWTEMQDTIGSTVYWIAIIFGVILTYFIIYLIGMALKSNLDKKKQRMEF